MIRTLLATTAIATLVATGAMAQATPTAPAPAPMGTTTTPETPMVVKAQGNLASNLIGQAVYNSAGENGENIGEVNDIVISPEGNVHAVVIGVGGFLGIGEKDVAIEYDLVDWTERDGKRWMVVETTSDALKAQPEFDRAAYQPMPADADVAETKPATKEDLANAPVADKTAAAPATAPATTNDTAAAPPVATDNTKTAAIDRSTLKPMDTSDIRTEDFVGTTVYGANDEMVGEIGDVALTPDGKVDAIIIDVGGFLGIGEKEVAVGMDNLAFLTDEDGDRYLYTAFTKEQLEAQPAYEKGAYAERRDEMRLVVPN